MDWESGYVAYYRQRLKAAGSSVLLYRILKPSSITVTALNARPARCLRRAIAYESLNFLFF